MVISTTQKKKLNYLKMKKIYPDDNFIILSTNTLELVDNVKIQITHSISEIDAIEISEFIKNENKIKAHMLEKTSEEIFNAANNNGCIKLSLDNNVV